MGATWVAFIMELGTFVGIHRCMWKSLSGNILHKENVLSNLMKNSSLSSLTKIPIMIISSLTLWDKNWADWNRLYYKWGDIENIENKLGVPNKILLLRYWTKSTQEKKFNNLICIKIYFSLNPILFEWKIKQIINSICLFQVWSSWGHTVCLGRRWPSRLSTWRSSVSPCSRQWRGKSRSWNWSNTKVCCVCTMSMKIANTCTWCWSMCLAENFLTTSWRRDG